MCCNFSVECWYPCRPRGSPTWGGHATLPLSPRRGSRIHERHERTAARQPVARGRRQRGGRLQTQPAGRPQDGPAVRTPGHRCHGAGRTPRSRRRCTRSVSHPPTTIFLFCW